MNIPLWGWVLFAAGVIFLLILDLFVLSRKSREIGFQQSVVLCCIWMSLAMIFDMGICHTAGARPALEFLAGYLIEYSLSIDNLFVFILIFSCFKVPREYQHKVLFWGILGALVLRMLFILAGVALVNRFHWIFYLFGLFLVFTGFKMVFRKEGGIDPEKNIALRFFKRLMPVTPQYRDGKFFVTEKGKTWATPLFIAVLVVESTDVVFALDSIPAIFAVTVDPFIVYTSNVFAILGLRSLYFALSGMMEIFRYLHYGIASVLVFVGIKMFAHDWVHISIGVSLGVIAFCLAAAIGASWVARGGDRSKA